MDIDSISPEALLEADIFELIGMQQASDEQKQAMLTEMERTVQGEILDRIITLLPENQLAAFEEVFEVGDQLALAAFLEQRGIDLQQVSTEEVLKYKYLLVHEVAARLAKEPAASTPHVP